MNKEKYYYMSWLTGTVVIIIFIYSLYYNHLLLANIGLSSVIAFLLVILLQSIILYISWNLAKKGKYLKVTSQSLNITFKKSTYFVLIFAASVLILFIVTTFVSVVLPFFK